MAIRDFFDHTCDIYHQVDDNTKSTGYSVLDTQKVTEYPTAADESAVICHFNVKDENIAARQGEPQRINDVRVTIAVPPGTDLRFNDKIVDLTHNLVYTVAKPPRNIRNNHIKAELYMREAQRDL